MSFGVRIKVDQIGFSERRKQLINSWDNSPSPKNFCRLNIQLKETKVLTFT